MQLSGEAGRLSMLCAACACMHVTCQFKVVLLVGTCDLEA
jgi:hypothetical protein